MPEQQPAAIAVDAASAPVLLAAPVRHRIFFYLGLLIILLAFGAPSGGLIDIPITFFLKNKLNLKAHELADFRLLAAVPLYLSFVFGFIRDSWDPFGMGDRGYLFLFGLVTAALYILFAFIPVSYWTLLIGVVLLTASSHFVASAQNGLASTIGQQNVMTGQVSAVWNIFISIPTVAALLLGGTLSERLENTDADHAVRILFLVGTAIMIAIAAYGAWKPKSVFANVRSEREPATQALAELKRLARHRPIYPALLIWLLWNFAPGSATPLQYHLQNTLNATNAQWGQWNAIFSASFIPTLALYGILCRRFALNRLLWCGTVAAIPQFVPLLFIDTVRQALLGAAAAGLMGGFATAAYWDLIIRSCPRGLQGTMLMMSSSLFFVVSRFGDVLGTRLYDYYGGFSACVAAIAVVYTLILPTLLLVPKGLIATADGEAPNIS